MILVRVERGPKFHIGRRRLSERWKAHPLSTTPPSMARVSRRNLRYGARTSCLLEAESCLK